MRSGNEAFFGLNNNSDLVLAAGWAEVVTWRLAGVVRQMLGNALPTDRLVAGLRLACGA